VMSSAKKTRNLTIHESRSNSRLHSRTLKAALKKCLAEEENLHVRDKNERKSEKQGLIFERRDLA